MFQASAEFRRLISTEPSVQRHDAEVYDQTLTERGPIDVLGLELWACQGFGQLEEAGRFSSAMKQPVR
jgi:hypothetical protein